MASGIPRAARLAMAISVQLAALLAHENRQRPFGGHLLQLGKQTILMDGAGFHRLASTWKLRDSQPGGPGDGPVTDTAFFGSLGFDRVSSADISDWEGADYLFDLNRPAPEDLAGQFDCVLDGGTVEHVFDVRQSLANIVRLLRVGGRVIHMAPSSNLIDHGFYMFSPTLFWDYYSANGFRVNESLVLEYQVNHSYKFLDPWTLYRYQPGCLDHVSERGLGARLLMLFFVATKERASTGDVIPQQSQYVRDWAEAKAGLPSLHPQRQRAALAVFKNLIRRVSPTGYIRLVDLYRTLFATRAVRKAGRANPDGTIVWY